jgi:uncharacterized repeat protein (TIGR02543 family)
MNTNIKSCKRTFALIIGLAILLTGWLVFIDFSGKSAAANVKSEAYYLFEDGATHGQWHTGGTGGNATGENVSRRLYGKAGVVLPYHKITGDGQPVRDASLLNDFTEGSTVNYVEYPGWISSVMGDINGAGDNPHGYWLYHDDASNLNDNAYPNSLLSVDPALYSRKDVFQITRDDMNYTFNVTDGNWHRVSVYIGATHQNTAAPSEYSYISILDKSGNILARVSASSYGLGKYYSFAAKGSFVLNIQTQKGTLATYCNGIFLDDDYVNPNIEKTNFDATVTGAKDVVLSWNNNSAAAETVIWRRSEDENNYSNLTRVSAAETGYTDSDTQVSTTYFYKVSAAVPRAGRPESSGVLDVVIPGAEKYVRTADYARTSIKFDRESYTLTNKKIPLDAAVTVKKDVIYDESGALTDQGTAFAGVEVVFGINGDTVYDFSTGERRPNMSPIIGKAITDASGLAILSATMYYAGEYTLTASIELQPDSMDPTQGYDGCIKSVPLSIPLPGSARSKPILFDATDAVRPGGLLTISGNFIYNDAQFAVAFAPAVGTKDAIFNESVSGLRYISKEAVTLIDDAFNTGLMFELPKNVAPGRYDFWIKNVNGWSNAITVNGVRPLYISQEASYDGLDIEVVGRNFFGTEFGMPENSLDDIKVKLVRVGGLTGIADGIEHSVTVSIKRGVRYETEQTYTGVAVDESNPYRITFITPNVGVGNYGTYDVYVSAQGNDFRPLHRPQKLILYPKKAKNFNAGAFGTGEGVTNNDPLGLGVYWAQDLDYTHVYTVPAGHNTPEFVSYAATDALTAAVQERINTFSTNYGGGVIYFPNGTYWLDSISLKPGIILVGESKANTNLKITHRPLAVVPDLDFDNWLVGTDANNIGIARLNISMRDDGDRLPDSIIVIGNSSPDSWDDAIVKTVQNVFVSDVKITLIRPEKFSEGLPDGSGRGRSGYAGKKNFLVQNFEYIGDHSPLDVGFSSYSYIRNSKIQMNGLGVGMGHKYAFVENTYLQSGHEGSGWSGRSDAYFAHNYVSNIGRLVKPNNYGEVVMFEPPGGEFSYGRILSAMERTFTVFTEEGRVVDGTTKAFYNYFAVVINEGKGTGQMRYFERAPVAGPDGQIYGNTYKLCDDERDWVVVPDETSRYAIFLPMEGQTVYRNNGEECAKSILIFSQCRDVVVAENNLQRTEGIGVWVGANSDGPCGTTLNIRIENNVINGVSPGTGKGGISLTVGRPEEGYVGLLMGGVTIRNNTLTNVSSGFLYSGSEFPSERGIVIKTGSTSGMTTPGDVRYVIIENNTVDKSEYGVYCDNNVTGVIVKDNNFADIEKGENITMFGPAKFFVRSHYTFYVNGTVDSALSGSYGINENLPVPTAVGGSFWGWSPTAEYGADQAPITTADGNSGILYAIFGFEIKLLYNYKDAQGNDKGEYKTVVAIVGEAISSPGNPVRAGYYFGGWYYDAACVEAFEDGTTVNESVVLYAKWIARDGDESDNTDVADGPQKGCGGCGSAFADSDLNGIVMLVVSAISVIALTIALRAKKKQKDEQNKN